VKGYNPNFIRYRTAISTACCHLSFLHFNLSQMMHYLFRFEFLGEPALDAGGVAREFFSVICNQIFNPDCGLFLYSAVNQMCMQINPNSGIANEHHLR